MPAYPPPTRVPVPTANVPVATPTPSAPQPHTAAWAKEEQEHRSSAMLQTMAVLVAFVVVFCAWLKFCTRQRKSKATRKNAALNVTALYIYPVKSCAALPQQTLTVDRLGFKWDRRFVVISSATGCHVSQREYPRMSLIQPRLLEKTGKLLLSFPGEPEMIEVELEPHKAASDAAAGVERAKVTVWDDTMQAYLYEDKNISVWLARVLQLPEGRAALRLGATLGPDDHRRPIQPPFDHTVPAAVAVAAAAADAAAFAAASSSASSTSAAAPAAAAATAVAAVPPIAPGFHDQFPVMLASESSLRAVNSWTEPRGRKVEMLSFRPNIVVAGPNLKPFAEDFWKRISIGPEAPVDPASPAGVAMAAAAALKDAQSLSRLKRKAATAAATAAERALAAQVSTLAPIQAGAGVDFHIAKPAQRCTVTTVVQSEGRFHPSGEPLLALREHRRILDHIPSQQGRVFFAQLCTPAASTEGGMLIGATIHVGDAVRVRERKMHAFDPVEGTEFERDREAIAQQKQERELAIAALVAKEAERIAAEAAAAAAEENAEAEVDAVGEQQAAEEASGSTLDSDEKQPMSDSKKDQ